MFRFNAGMKLLKCNANRIYVRQKRLKSELAGAVRQNSFDLPVVPIEELDDSAHLGDAAVVADRAGERAEEAGWTKRLRRHLERSPNLGLVL